MRIKVRIVVLAATLLSVPAVAKDTFEESFRNPPSQAKPRVWWHWMGGNITAEGAALDLEWMKRVGIGGVHVFSGAIRDPKVVDEPMPFMSPQWQRVFRQSVSTLRSAGMEVTIAGSPGWSQTGGPWVTPADGMKKYVWSETTVEGGRSFRELLNAPPTTSGPFLGATVTHDSEDTTPEFYEDTHVVAFRTPETEVKEAQPAFTLEDRPLDLSKIVRADLSNSVKVPIKAGTSHVSLEAHFAQPTQISALSLGIQSPVGTGVEVQVSDDGREYRRLTRVEPIAINTIDVPPPQRTYAFEPTTAKYFRVGLLAPPPAEPLPGTPKAAPRQQPWTEFVVTNLKLHPGPRLDRFEAQVGFEASMGQHQSRTIAPQAGIIPKAGVLDLTSRRSSDGHLNWKPPAGKWTVLRFGSSLTGHKNGPAEPDATGLEVDKLDAGAVRRYIKSYLSMYANATGGLLGPGGVQNLLLDSWEAGVQTWTPTLVQEFRDRRKYDPLPFFPVLTGRVVESVDLSERFLWDYRQTLKELVATNHHEVIAQELHSRQMGLYAEAQGDTPRAIADGLALKARSDIPTGEFWYRPFATAPGQPSLKADLEEAASAAHLYGKPFVAAEAFTVAAGDDPWSFSPRMLKPVADEIFARGVNRILYHESHLQPLVDKKPGLAMFIFGQYFNRNETWAEDAKPWIDYLSRTSHLLQQGRYVADVAYFYGEEKNLTELFRTRFNDDVPKGYSYDYVNSEALLTLLSVENGRIVTPSGMSYRLLYVPAHVTRYSLGTLRKLRQLVAAGAILVGPEPVGGLGIASPDADIHQIAKDIWGAGATSAKGHKLGLGTVYATTDLAQVLAAEKIAPDVSFAGVQADSNLLTLHRRSDEADIYFVSNQRPRVEAIEASFRVTGKSPELWRAETGEVEKLSYSLRGDRVVTPLTLAPHEAAFVVFRHKADAPRWTAPVRREATLATLRGPWAVSFERGRGAPTTASFSELISWADATDEGIRYFSGAGTYVKDVVVPTAWLDRGQRIYLDLGKVHELATVVVNEKAVGTAWHAPYRLDITDALRRGKNRLKIKVVNLWPNRLIGDKQPRSNPVTFAPENRYKASSPLLDSGLLGPVRLVGIMQTD